MSIQFFGRVTLCFAGGVDGGVLGSGAPSARSGAALGSTQTTGRLHLSTCSLHRLAHLQHPADNDLCLLRLQGSQVTRQLQRKQVHQFLRVLYGYHLDGVCARVLFRGQCVSRSHVPLTSGHSECVIDCHLHFHPKDLRAVFCGQERPTCDAKIHNARRLKATG